MFKLFRRERGKKGFTLAELLVVIAILAILVAVAIPIFTGALKDAEDAVKKSAVRSVKAAAVTAILSDWSKYGKDGDAVAQSWTVGADVSKTGDISGLSIAASKDPSTAEEDITKVVTDGQDGGYTITGMVIVDVAPTT